MQQHKNSEKMKTRRKMRNNKMKNNHDEKQQVEEHGCNKIRDKNKNNKNHQVQDEERINEGKQDD